MFTMGVGQYSMILHRGPLPNLYGEYRQHAKLAEEFDIKSAEGEGAFLAIGAANDWPLLVVAQRFNPCQAGFNSGAWLVPEARVLFVGAGRRLLAYDLGVPRRLWEDSTEGFWGWAQFGDVVLMSGEMELAAWRSNGSKLWTTFVEPSWSYEVESGTVRLDVMGQWSEFDLATGPGS